MDINEFSYDLPSGRIATTPSPRGGSKLFVYDRRTGETATGVFGELLPERLDERYILVINKTKVIKARVFGKKETGGKVEVLFTTPGNDGGVRGLLRSRLPVGASILFPEGISARITGYEDSEVLLDLSVPVSELTDRFGEVPLPPYIKKKIESQETELERYNTVYASEHGSIAAPTAGLHFSAEIIEVLKKKGVSVRELVLHIGPPSFVPLRGSTTGDIILGRERYSIAPELPEELSSAKAAGKKILCVGTSTVRALETAARTGRTEGMTDLFIHGRFDFKMADAMLTNFHLPRSTHFILVSSFLGSPEKLKELYMKALDRGFMFYSYGDSMLIL